MDNRPIGVFDSGLGGLTAVRRFMQVMPFEDIIYLGDTGRVPYGSRSRETIIRYSKQDASFLSSFDIKAIVVACNTASAAAVPTLKEQFSTPVFGVLEATCEKAAQTTKNGKIGVIGTQGTINSGAYKKSLSAIDNKLSIYEQACPLFVPLVENGRTEREDIVVKTLVSDYLRQIKENGVDTLILGCTHYPLLFDAISDFMGGKVTLIDSGAATAERVCEYLRKNNMLSDKTQCGDHRYYVTDTTESFSETASVFLGCDIRGNVEKISLEGF